MNKSDIFFRLVLLQISSATSSKYVLKQVLTRSPYIAGKEPITALCGIAVQ